METMSQFASEKDLWKARCIRFATALVDVMDGTQDHDIQADTGLPDADCERIAKARSDAFKLVHNAEDQAVSAENARLAREAHTWWTACADATKTQEELAMMVRMLTSSLKRHWPHAPQPGDLPSRAMDLLRRHNLMGSPLRDESNNRAPQQGA